MEKRHLVNLGKGVKVWCSYIAPKKNKITLYFIHGLVHNHTAWKNVANDFAKRGYGILTIDLPGHGLSPAPKSIKFYSMKSLGKMCMQIAKKFKIKDCVIIGHSLGGMITQYMLKLKPKAIVFVATTYINPIPDMVSEKNFFFKTIPEACGTVIDQVAMPKKQRLIDFSKPVSNDEILNWLTAASATSAHALIYYLGAITSLNSAKELKKINCPTLLIGGTDDTDIPIGRMNKMKKKIKNSHLVVINNVSHNINLFAPKELIVNIKAFLTRLSL